MKQLIATICLALGLMVNPTPVVAKTTFVTIGTGGIKVNNPRALIETRMWQKKHYAFDLQNLKSSPKDHAIR